VPDDDLSYELPEKVAGRLESELGGRAGRILRCLRTAGVLLKEAETDDRDLRLAESVAYNVREALNSVVEGRQEDAADGGLRAVIDGWRRFQVEVSQPSADITAARDVLDGVLARVSDNESNTSYHNRRLLDYLSERAGVPPSERRSGPVAEYADLRAQANSAVHTEIALTRATSLFTRTVAWFVRMFTPPDEVVNAIRSLAAQPWLGTEQIAQLESLATTDHHLRLFFNEISDPAWLVPLHSARIAHLPKPGTPWPVAALLDGLGRTAPMSVASLLDDLLSDTNGLAVDEQMPARFELLRVSVQLGPAGHDLVGKMLRQHGDVQAVRALSVGAAQQADPTDPVVRQVADIVLNHFQRFRDGDHYYATTMLDRLQAGVTDKNIAERAQMLSGKTRRRARLPEQRYVLLGIEALSADVDEHPEPLLLLAHHLARLLSKAHRFGIPTSTQLEWLGTISGEVGERIHCHVLASANDVNLADKIAHIAHRLASPVATGDDLALVNDILARDPDPQDLAVWSSALGTPSPAPENADDPLPEDWVRAWRWAAVLPGGLLTQWQEQIAVVADRHGSLDPNLLTGPRTPTTGAYWVRSPYGSDQLAVLSVPDAAELVATWRPTGSDHSVSALELARSLQDTVEHDPVSWSTDPLSVVTTLSDAIYVEHYFRGLAKRAGAIVPHATALLAAAAAARMPAEAPDPSDEGSPTPSGDRPGLEAAILDLVVALANQDADIASHLEALWEWVAHPVHDMPDDMGLMFSDLDALASAINRPWGRGLQAVLALAAWEYRHAGAVRPDFEQTLDEVTNTHGTVGLELRAIIASARPLLEGIAREWLDTHADALFRDGTHARDTFDLTIKWARPTAWLYRNFNAELFDAAQRGVENAARNIVIATLNNVEGYAPDDIIPRLRTNPDVLSSVAEEAAFLVQDAAADSPQLAAAARFWALLVDADRANDSGQSLLGLGRWSFVANVDDNRWADLTIRTLAQTDGQIDYSISVADRAATAPPSPTTRGILLRLLDHGEPWERHHAAQKALEVLRASTNQHVDQTFQRLRTRLIDLGYHQASDIEQGEAR
jgi:hypothetical protein